MSADAFILTIPAPGSFVSSNERYHWAVKHKLMKAWKERAHWAARAAHLPRITQPVTITATIHRDHNRGRWDVGNLTDTAKAAIDGLVTAGVLIDDSNRYVVGPDMRAGEPRDTAQLVLTIRLDRRGSTA
jgi:crossover junction endodeoxyribonuclease RusA